MTELPEMPTEPAPITMAPSRRGLIVAALFLLLAALGVWWMLAHRGHTLSGTLSSPTCDGGYNIVNAAVTVSDENGTVIGSATTSAMIPLSPDEPFVCKVSFSVAVGNAKFYTLKVGTHDAPSFSRSDLENQGWHVDLSLT